MKKLRVTVDGRVFDVIVEALDEHEPHGHPAPASRPPASVGPAEPAAPPPAPAAGEEPGDVPSPLAGRVVSLDCEVGGRVEVGDRLITLEAMKMNTYVNSPSAGTVAAIHVAPGDPVEEGQLLVTVK